MSDKMKFLKDHMGVIVCKHVRDDLRPILLVTHYNDGEWAFTCGESDHGDDDDEYSLVGIGHLLSRDSSIECIANLKAGFSAERSAISEEWHRYVDNDN